MVSIAFVHCYVHSLDCYFAGRVWAIWFGVSGVAAAGIGANGAAGAVFGAHRSTVHHTVDGDCVYQWQSAGVVCLRRAASVGTAAKKRLAALGRGAGIIACQHFCKKYFAAVPVRAVAEPNQHLVCAVGAVAYCPWHFSV